MALVPEANIYVYIQNRSHAKLCMYVSCRLHVNAQNAFIRTKTDIFAHILKSILQLNYLEAPAFPYTRHNEKSNFGVFRRFELDQILRKTKFGRRINVKVCLFFQWRLGLNFPASLMYCSWLICFCRVGHSSESVRGSVSQQTGSVGLGVYGKCIPQEDIIPY